MRADCASPVSATMSRHGATHAKPWRAAAATASGSFHCRRTVARLSETSSAGMVGLRDRAISARSRLQLILQRLRGHADRRIDGAEAVVVAALDQLEEETVIEGARIGMEELAAGRAVVQDREAAHLGDARRWQVVHGRQIVVVAARN